MIGIEEKITNQERDIKQDTTQEKDFFAVSNPSIWMWAKNGKYLFLQIPNCILWAIVIRKFNFTETKIMLYLCRMSFGYKGRHEKKAKNETNYLHTDDFVTGACISRSHVSESLGRLIKEGHIIRSHKYGGCHRYRVNLEPYEIKGLAPTFKSGNLTS